MSIHHLWDNLPPNKIDLFPYVDVLIDIQWYIKDLSDYLSFSILCLVLYINVKGSKIKIIALFLFVFSITNIIGYLLVYLQYNLLIQSVFLGMLGIYLIWKKK